METIDLQGLGSLKAFERSRFNLLLQETDHVTCDGKIPASRRTSNPTDTHFLCTLVHSNLQ